MHYLGFRVSGVRDSIATGYPSLLLWQCLCLVQGPKPFQPAYYKGLNNSLPILFGGFLIVIIV